MADGSAWVRALAEKEQAALQKKVLRGFKLLSEADGSEPTRVLPAIMRARALAAVDLKPKAKFEALGLAWMRLVDQHTAWKLKAWAWASGFRPMVFSPDGALAIDGVHLVQLGANATHGLTESSVAELFEAIPSPSKDVISRYSGCGVLKPCAHLAQR